MLEKLHLDPFHDQIGSPGSEQRCRTITLFLSGVSITEGICWKTLTSYNFWPSRKCLFCYMTSDPQSCQSILYSAKPSLWHVCSYLWWNFCTSCTFCGNVLHKQPNKPFAHASSSTEPSKQLGADILPCRNAAMPTTPTSRYSIPATTKQGRCLVRTGTPGKLSIVHYCWLSPQ